MARISERFASNYFKTDDIKTHMLGRKLTIVGVVEETIGDEEKLVAYFDGLDKGLPLNRTNSETLAETLGDDTDDWAGGIITLKIEKTNFQGKRVDSIRIRSVEAPAQEKATGTK